MQDESDVMEPMVHQDQEPGHESRLEPKPDWEPRYKGSDRLKGKVALITGADSGIGRAVALAFAREGADIAIAYLDEDEDATETARVVTDAGRRSVTLPGDIRDEGHCHDLVTKTVDEFGRLDILVNNAAFQSTQNSIQELTSELWDRAFKTNIYATFYLSKAALTRMPPGSVIINTASIEAYQPSPTLIHYASTKGAIVTFTKALAQEAIKQGIRVNAVAPGPVWTPLIPATMPADKNAEFGADSPMGRPAQPAELAPAYVFLASPEASYVNGEIVGVTGGKPLA